MASCHILLMRRTTIILALGLVGCARSTSNPGVVEARPSPPIEVLDQPECIDRQAAALRSPCSALEDELGPGPPSPEEAEAAYIAEDWSTCAELFARLSSSTLAPAEQAEAAYAAVICRQNALIAAREAARPPPRPTGPAHLTPRPLAPPELAFDQACARYLCIAPQGPDAPTVLYRRARLYYDANHWDEAATLFRQVVGRFPEHETAPFATNLYLDALNILSRRHERRREPCRALMEEEVERFLAMPELSGDLELSDTLRHLRCQLEREHARALGEAGRHLEAAQLYLQLFRRQEEDCGPLNDNMDEVLSNAAHHFETAGQPERAAEVRAILAEQWPNSP